jgi:NADPH-dependent F420 reductase
MSNPKVSIIGTGSVGGNLGSRLSSCGLAVQFGVREGTDLKDLLARCGKDTSAASLEAAATWGDIVFLALPADAAVDVARSLATPLRGKVVVDCTNPLTWNAGPVWAPPPEGSNAAAIAKVAPGSQVVKGFNTFGAEFHKDPEHAGKPGAQVFLAGDDAEAKKAVTQVATKAGFRAVDSGPMRNAAVLENLAVLWIHLAVVGGQSRDFVFAIQRN